jgi:hypothetical protein
MVTKAIFHHVPSFSNRNPWTQPGITGFTVSTLPQFAIRGQQP